MVDIYQPAVLNRVVQDLKSVTPIPFLLNTFFGEVSISNQEEIYFDILSGKPRLAPFVSPLVEGQIVHMPGFQTKSFTPAYIKDKRVLEDGKAVRRRAGQPISGPISPMDQRLADIAANAADQLAMLYRRLEWMAARVLLTGSVTISGEKYPTTVVNFGRDAGLTVTLAGGALWSAPTTALPLNNLETWNGLIRTASGANAVDVIMAQNVFNALRNTDQWKAQFDPYKTDSRTNVDTGPNPAVVNDATRKGTVGGFNIWVYEQTYVDDAGSTQKYLPDDYLIMVAGGAQGLEGVQHFGAIKDEDSGFQPMDYFAKSWRTPDPGVRWMLLQSAPLVVPYRTNASLAAKVL